MKNYLRKLFIILSFFLSLFLISCSSSDQTVKINEYGYEDLPYAYYELPLDFKDQARMNQTLADYSESLTGKIIFIDPGHGGDDRKNTSRDGTIVEADINLMVALHLRGFLQRSGANVIMSRESDTTISLERRSELANASGADLFISIHHNSTSDKSNYWTNYTSTFYHASPGIAKYSPYNHTIAKYVQRDLSYALRNPGSLASFDGTMSDYLIYPDQGFAVLRETDIPSILVECAFFTSRLEEKRLNLDQFNKVEAWGIYIGIAKFYKKNSNSIVLSDTKSQFLGDDLHLIIETSDSKPLDPSKMQIYLNNTKLTPEETKMQKTIMVIIKNPAEGNHQLNISYIDEEGYSPRPLNKQIVIK
jgi:N-acetylmuramoyl-L-alanine amidase